jgi:O-antigen/teichoic acid export membrane protein
MIKTNLRILLAKISGSVFMFLATIILSKQLTLTNYGTYEVLIRISLLVSTISLFGIPTLINRTKTYFEAKKIFNRALPTIISLNLIFTGFTCLVIFIFKEDFRSGLLIILAGIMFPLYRIIGALYLKKKIYIKAVLSDDVLFHFIFCISLFVLLYFYQELNLFNVSLLVLISRIASFLYFKSGINLKRFKPNIELALLKSSSSLFTQTIVQKLINNLPIILCGILFTKEETGVFALSVRLSSIYLILLGGFNVFITPRISENMHSNKFKIFIRKAILLFFIFSTVVFIINVLFSNYIALLWDEIQGDNLMIYLIILFGYLINLSTGSVGLLLNMNGLEKKHLQVNLVSVALILLSSFLVFFHHSIIYFAISISLIIGLENVLKLIAIRKILKVL